ncbi:MAG: hypothetical protein WB791_09165 [Waddliaceae bacterium]
MLSSLFFQEVTQLIQSAEGLEAFRRSPAGEDGQKQTSLENRTSELGLELLNEAILSTASNNISELAHCLQFRNASIASKEEIQRFMEGELKNYQEEADLQKKKQMRVKLFALKRCLSIKRSANRKIVAKTSVVFGIGLVCGAAYHVSGNVHFCKKALNGLLTQIARLEGEKTYRDLSEYHTFKKVGERELESVYSAFLSTPSKSPS